MASGTGTATGRPDPIPRIDSHGLSRIGAARHTNSDQFLVADLERAAHVHYASAARLDHSRQFGEEQAHLLLVADGGSGDADARRASSLAVDQVMAGVLNAVPWAPILDIDAEAGLRRGLEETVVQCNLEVVDAGRDRPGASAMATTLTLAFVRWPLAVIVHAGDCRAYLISNAEIRQLTTDHTLAQMIDQVARDPQQATTSRFGEMLWNAVGGAGEVTPEVDVARLVAGDTLLLCTDGLTRVLNDESIRAIVAAGSSARAACHGLIDAATSAGAEDDVTLTVARFEEPALNRTDSVSAPAGAATAAADIPRPSGAGPAVAECDVDA